MYVLSRYDSGYRLILQEIAAKCIKKFYLIVYVGKVKIVRGKLYPTVKTELGVFFVLVSQCPTDMYLSQPYRPAVVSPYPNTFTNVGNMGWTVNTEVWLSFNPNVALVLKERYQGFDEIKVILLPIFLRDQ